MNCASNVNSSYYLRPTLMTCLQSKKKFDLVPTFTQIDNIYFIFYHLKLTSTLLCSRMYFFPSQFRHLLSIFFQKCLWNKNRCASPYHHTPGIHLKHNTNTTFVNDKTLRGSVFKNSIIAINGEFIFGSLYRKQGELVESIKSGINIITCCLECLHNDINIVNVLHRM